MGWSVNQWVNTPLPSLVLYKEDFNADPDLSRVHVSLVNKEGVARTWYQDPDYNKEVVQGIISDYNRKVFNI